MQKKLQRDLKYYGHEWRGPKPKQSPAASMFFSDNLVPYANTIVGNDEVNSTLISTQNNCFLNNDLQACETFGWNQRHDTLIQPSEV